MKSNLILILKKYIQHFMKSYRSIFKASTSFSDQSNNYLIIKIMTLFEGLIQRQFWGKPKL